MEEYSSLHGSRNSSSESDPNCGICQGITNKFSEETVDVPDTQQIEKALPVIVDGGTFSDANFGPRNTKQVFNASHSVTINNHSHHYYGEDGLRKPCKDFAEGDETEEYTTLSNTIIMYRREPLREGSKIYRGEQTHVASQRKNVAIKIACYDKKNVKEVEHLLKLDRHDNVVRIIASGECKGAVREFYIAMELCHQQNLQDYINEAGEQKKPLDFKQTMSYSRQLACGLCFIHENNLIHGDLKPGNVLFSEDRQTLKVADFGITKELKHGRSVTKATRGPGTDGYRAPETYNSDEVSQYADIFSFALVLSVLWSNGKHPFGEEEDLWNYRIKKNAGFDLSGILIRNEESRLRLAELLEKMLKFVPQDRSTCEKICCELSLTWPE